MVRITHSRPTDRQSSLFSDGEGDGENATPRRTSADEFLVVPFTVLYDHRESTGGWTFSGLVGDSRRKNRPLIVPTEKIHMVTADYTVKDVPVFIERKSHDDFIGSITGGHHNLELEFGRMQAIVAAGGYCCMVVESSMDRICDELESPASMRKAKAANVLGVVASWPARFQVPILFAGSRRYAELLAFSVMDKFVESYRKKLKETKEAKQNESTDETRN